MSDVGQGPTTNEFSAAEKAAVYRAIYTRRDVRGQFRPDPVPDNVLLKLLDCAHHAGSVGFMQPWSFIIIRSEEVKRGVHDLFEKANEAAAAVFNGERRQLGFDTKRGSVFKASLHP